MGFRRGLVGLALLVGATAFFVQKDPPVLHSGEAAVSGATTAVGNAIGGWLGTRAAASATGPSSTSDVVDRSGEDASGSSVSSKSVVANRAKGRVGAATGAMLPITTNNAPPPTPTVIDGVAMRYNPFQPSDGPYPTLTSQEHVWMDVSIAQELVYIFNGKHLLYTMITSSGIDTKPDNSTPLGVYHIQSERGDWFYSQPYQMGAKYWTSWLGHGIFLFHSVPMNQNKQLLPKIAAELGHPASHGCFHLTVPDAAWVYHNIPYRTTVVVEQAPVKLRGNALWDPSSDQRAAEGASTQAAGAAGEAATPGAISNATASSNGTSQSATISNATASSSGTS